MNRRRRPGAAVIMRLSAAARRRRAPTSERRPPQGKSSALVAVLLASSAAACVPLVSHGPRVQPGMRYFINTAVTTSHELQGDNGTPLPTIYLGAAHGWARDEEGPALSLGLQLPLLLVPAAMENDALTMLSVTYLDVYVQPQRAAWGGLDYGVGALASPDVAMPYFQLGRAGNGGFYTTQALAFTFDHLNEATYWIPTFAFHSERPDGSRGVDFYVSGAVGRADRDARGNPPNRPTEWYLTAGVLLEFARRR